MRDTLHSYIGIRRCVYTVCYITIYCYNRTYPNRTYDAVQGVGQTQL